MPDHIEFLSAVIIVSRNPERLARFYREVVGIDLADERHGDSLPHFGTTLGDIHFAIHPVETFPGTPYAVGAVKIALSVFDLEATVKRIKERGVRLLYPPRDTGYFISTAIEDPDGNFIELTRMCDDWFRRLEQRKAEGIDPVARWKSLKEKNEKL